MKDTIRLAWFYISAHRGQSLAMVVAVSLTLSLPVVTVQLVSRYQQQLQTRSGNPPLLLGPEGSRYDLVLKVQYFLGTAQTPTQWSVYSKIAENENIRSVPIHLLHTAREETSQVVGTSADYFTARAIPFATGNTFVHPGQCVVGSAVATANGVVRTDIANPFDLSAPAPLELTVVGRLARTGTPDDLAVFVSMETAWVLDGYGHGHDEGDRGRAAAAGSVLAESEDGHRPTETIARIDDSNRHKIHFHGNRDHYPVSAVLMWPKTQRDAVIMEGKFMDHASLQVLRPDTEIQRLLEYVFRIEDMLQRVFMLLTGITLLLVVVIVWQSLNMRRRDLETMRFVGCSRIRVSALLVTELMLLVVSSAVLAMVLSALLIQVLPSLETIL